MKRNSKTRNRRWTEDELELLALNMNWWEEKLFVIVRNFSFEEIS